MHTLPHTLEGLEVVWVVLARDPLLLLEHRLALSEESLHGNNGIPSSAYEHAAFIAVHNGNNGIDISQHSQLLSLTH